MTHVKTDPLAAADRRRRRPHAILLAFVVLGAMAAGCITPGDPRDESGTVDPRPVPSESQGRRA